jgi:uncharacterized protein YoxC
MSENRFKKSIASLSKSNTSNVTDEVNGVKNETVIANNTTLNNILDDITKKPQGKNYAFHLSQEVGEAITKIAKRQNVSKSKLVDSILRQVLLQGGSLDGKQTIGD